MIWSSEEKFKEPRYKTQWYNKFKEKILQVPLLT